MFTPQPMTLIMPTFQDCSNPGAGGPQVRCYKWFAPPGGPGQWLQAQGLLEADSWWVCWAFFILSFNASQQYCTLFWVLGIQWWETDWSAPCPHGTHNLVGRGTNSHHYHLGLWEGWETSQKWPGREKEGIGGVGKKPLTQEAAPGGQGGSREGHLRGLRLFLTGHTKYAPRQKFERQSGEAGWHSGHKCSQVPFTPVK